MISIRQIEEISMRAIPSLHTIYYDGWVLRFAKGLNKRTNCVNPIYKSTLPFKEKIKHCETQYTNCNLPTFFKIVDGLAPKGLDELLGQVGYEACYNISVQTMDLSNVEVALDKPIACLNSVNKWVDCVISLNPKQEPKSNTLEEIIGKIKQKKCLMVLKSQNEIIGCGLGVVENGLIGLFEIAIAEKYRNCGNGLLLTENILKWGRGEGAHTAYLQVLKNNCSAVRVYEKLGFRHYYEYWYRIKQ